MLYEDNTFQLSWPVAAIRWLRTIGVINTGFLRTLRIFVEGVVEQSSRKGWYELFRKLGREAKGLRSMSIYLDREGMHRGLGSDEQFVQALVKKKAWKN